MVVLFAYVGIDEQDIAKPIAELLVRITSLNIDKEVQNRSKNNFSRPLTDVEFDGASENAIKQHITLIFRKVIIDQSQKQ